MVEAMLRIGHWTGMYTSPHLYDYVERIAINGAAIGRDIFARLVADLRPAADETARASPGRTLVTFDLLTALGFMTFRDADVSAQIVEVGLGGRVDSTNVFERKEVAVITPISLEHSEILGDTVEKIAKEKAAIIAAGCTAIIAPQPYHDADAVVRQSAREAGATIVDIASRYRWLVVGHGSRHQDIRIHAPNHVMGIRLPLLGRHQAENAATAIAAVDALADPMVSKESMLEGLANVHLPCRIEVLRENPLLIVDGAHNRDSARRLAETLVEYFACDRALFVIGCGSDKDIEGLAEELAPLASRVIATRAEHLRAMAPERIVEAFGRLNVDTEIVESVAAAVERALAETGESGVICVAGSLFVAAEARASVLGLPAGRRG